MINPTLVSEEITEQRRGMSYYKLHFEIHSDLCKQAVILIDGKQKTTDPH